MKAAPFEYERPASLDRAARLLGSEDRAAKILAGGQSLGPMLNLRLATPQLLVDVRRIAELSRAENDGDAVVLGACVTHAAIEDGRVPDGTRGIMPRVARGIAYRAIRNRGTLGGSLAHADPAADWVVGLAALDAEALVFSERGRRRVPISRLVVGPFETSLASDEIIEAVRIPRVSARARWGFYKVSRKAGKFAEAMAAVLRDPERNVQRAVMGAMESKPIVIEDASPLLDGGEKALFDGPKGRAVAMLKKAGLTGDEYSIQIHVVALRRALAQARAK